MFSPKYEDPRSRQAIQSFLAQGGTVTRCAANAHGACQQRRGPKFNGSKASNPIDEERIKVEQFRPAARLTDDLSTLPTHTVSAKYQQMAEREGY